MENLKNCRKEKNKKMCTCSYEPCVRKGVCCECVEYHIRSREIPGCFFPGDVEKTYDRSLEYFIEAWSEKLGKPR